jgi:RNA polymerase sigma factor (sigma-70 family)
MNEKDIQLLIQGCLRQDGQSQRELYRSFYVYAMTTASRYAPRLHDAEEIVNDAFFKVFTRIETYNEMYSFKPWLSKIIVNTAINHFQKYHRNEFATDTIENIPNQQNIQTEPVVLSKLSQEELLRLVQSLPPAYRMVFNLYAIEGYKHEEIAQMLNIAEKTSQSNLVRARQKLQRMIVALDSVTNYK